MEEKRKNNSKEDWNKNLTREQYHILKEKGTEKPFTGEYLHNKENGTYNCVACGLELFSSDVKFDSGTGWPSFTDPVNKKNITLKEDSSYGMHRIEVVCKKCRGHLGHLFPDGPNGKNRFCINSTCLNFKKKS